MSEFIDIGHGVAIKFTCYNPEDYPDAPNPSGCLIRHPNAKDPSQDCYGGVVWWRPESEYGRTVWTLNSLEPLDISPSVLCSCGSHGFIKAGRWMPA
jgi:hypothetical protein